MLVKTLIFSFILVVLSIIGLSIGLIITGKQKLKKGCGTNPNDPCDKGRCEACNSPKGDDYSKI